MIGWLWAGFLVLSLKILQSRTILSVQIEDPILPLAEPFLTCTRCFKVLPFRSFTSAMLNGYWRRGEVYRLCKRCQFAVSLKKYFNITIEQWLDLWHIQDGCCAICKVKFTVKDTQATNSDPTTDHDHKTGKIRGIVHRGCNAGIGQFRDNPEALRLAAQYLEQHTV